MTIEQQIDAERLEALQAIVANENLTKETRTWAAKEIIERTTAGRLTGALADDHPDIADDDPDVLALTRPLDAEGLTLAEDPLIRKIISPKTLIEAKTLVEGRRRIRFHLARVVDETLQEEARLDAIRAILPILEKLAPLACNDERWDLEQIGGVPAEWLLGHLPWQHRNPPQRCCELWPWR
jgi:hypothetical protein